MVASGFLGIPLGCCGGGESVKRPHDEDDEAARTSRTPSGVGVDAAGAATGAGAWAAGLGTGTAGATGVAGAWISAGGGGEPWTASGGAGEGERLSTNGGGTSGGGGRVPREPGVGSAPPGVATTSARLPSGSLSGSAPWSTSCAGAAGPPGVLPSGGAARGSGVGSLSTSRGPSGEGERAGPPPRSSSVRLMTVRVGSASWGRVLSLEKGQRKQDQRRGGGTVSAVDAAVVAAPSRGEGEWSQLGTGDAPVRFPLCSSKSPSVNSTRPSRAIRAAMAR